MQQPVPARSNEPQLDEEVWRAWVHKNKAKDKVRLVRLKKLLAIVVMLGIAVIVLWKIAS